MASTSKGTCTFPNCIASSVMESYTKTLDSLKDDLKMELTALHSDQKLILAAISTQGIIQAEMANLTKELQEAKDEHDGMFNRLRELESVASVNRSRLGALEERKNVSEDNKAKISSLENDVNDLKDTKGKGNAWVWDVAKILLVASITAVALHIVGK